MGSVSTISPSGGMNRVQAVKQIGVNPNAKYQGVAIPAELQQAMYIRRKIANMPKGSNLSVTITNNHATNSQAFLAFDTNGIAAAKGASANGADIEYTTTFAGGSTYASLKSITNGTHVGSLGTMFQVSDEQMFNTMNVLVWNGNYEDYNSKSLTNYLQLAKDTYANDPKILVIASELYLNGFFALSGTLPAQKSLTILFNLVEWSNF